MTEIRLSIESTGISEAVFDSHFEGENTGKKLVHKDNIIGEIGVAPPVADLVALKALTPSHGDIRRQIKYSDDENHRCISLNRLRRYDATTSKNDYGWGKTGTAFDPTEAIYARPDSIGNDIIKVGATYKANGDIEVNDATGIVETMRVTQADKWAFNSRQGNASRAWAFMDLGNDIDVAPLAGTTMTSIDDFEVVGLHNHTGAGASNDYTLLNIQISGVQGDHTWRFDGVGTISIPNESGTIPGEPLGVGNSDFVAGEKVTASDANAFDPIQVGDFIREGAEKQERKVLWKVSGNELYVRGDPWDNDAQVGFEAPAIGDVGSAYQIRTAAGTGLFRKGTQICIIDADAQYGSSRGTSPGNNDGIAKMFRVLRSRWDGTQTIIEANVEDPYSQSSIFTSVNLTTAKIGVELRSVRLNGTFSKLKWEGREEEILLNDTAITGIAGTTISTASVNPFGMDIEIDVIFSPPGRWVAVHPEDDFYSPDEFGANTNLIAWTNDGGITQIDQTAYDALSASAKLAYTPLYDDHIAVQACAWSHKRKVRGTGRRYMIDWPTGQGASIIRLSHDTEIEGGEFVPFPNPVLENKTIFALFGTEDVTIRKAIFNNKDGRRFMNPITIGDGWGRNRRIYIEECKAFDTNINPRTSSADSWMITCGGPVEELYMNKNTVDYLQLCAGFGTFARNCYVDGNLITNSTENAISFSSRRPFLIQDGIYGNNNTIHDSADGYDFGPDTSDATDSFRRNVHVTNTKTTNTGKSVSLVTCRWQNENIYINGVDARYDNVLPSGDNRGVRLSSELSFGAGPTWTGRTNYKNVRIYNVSTSYNETGILAEYCTDLVIKIADVANCINCVMVLNSEKVKLLGVGVTGDANYAPGTQAQYGILVRDSTGVDIESCSAEMLNDAKNAALAIETCTDVRLKGGVYEGAREVVVKLVNSVVKAWNVTAKNPNSANRDIWRIEIGAGAPKVELINCEGYDENSFTGTESVATLGAGDFSNVRLIGRGSYYNAAVALTLPIEGFSISGSGAPTANASYIDQIYKRTDVVEVYIAVATGTGASDWVQIG